MWRKKSHMQVHCLPDGLGTRNQTRALHVVFFTICKMHGTDKVLQCNVV